MDPTVLGSINARLGVLAERMEDQTVREAHRLAAWGMVEPKNATGAQLLNPGTNAAYTKDELLSMYSNLTFRHLDCIFTIFIEYKS